jgi:hypothetical protein
MKIVNRAQFLAMPANTVYAKYEPCSMGHLEIKGDSIGQIDFFSQQITDAVGANDSSEFVGLLQESERTGASVPMDFNCMYRDGLFDEDQLFAVFETRDVEKLIERLKRCL